MEALSNSAVFNKEENKELQKGELKALRFDLRNRSEEGVLMKLQRTIFGCEVTIIFTDNDDKKHLESAKQMLIDSYLEKIGSEREVTNNENNKKN